MVHLHSLCLALGLVFIFTPAVNAEESFDGITCQADIAMALIGRHMTNERIVDIETRYQSIGLKHLGAFGMEREGDPWTLIFWNICGREYLALEHSDIVKDVVASPYSSGNPPAQIASCTVDGSILKGTAVFFKNTVDKKDVKHAWLIDDKAIKFVRITGNEIVCTP